MPTIQELYRDAIEYENEFLAHYIYHLIQDKKIELSDQNSKLQTVAADYEKLKEIRKNNVLGMRKIKTFSIKMSDTKFCFIYASDRVAALLHYRQLHNGHDPINCIDYIYEDMLVPTAKRLVSFRDYKKEFTNFPVFIGYYER